MGIRIIRTVFRKTGTRLVEKPLPPPRYAPDPTRLNEILKKNPKRV